MRDTLKLFVVLVVYVSQPLLAAGVGVLLDAGLFGLTGPFTVFGALFGAASAMATTDRVADWVGLWTFCYRCRGAGWSGRCDHRGGR